MKKYIPYLLVVMMLIFLGACGLKTAIQDKTLEVLDNVTGLDLADTAASAAASTSSTGGKYEKEFSIYIGDEGNWTPFSGETGVSFSLSNKKLLDVKDDGQTIKFTGKAGGECIITASLGTKKIQALVRVSARGSGGGTTWTLHFDEATVLDMMSLAVVDYDLELTATHTGADMFGLYTGEIGMEYSADLSGLQGFLAMSGVDMDYSADGWFKNTGFKMELMHYNLKDEEHFIDSLKDPNITDEERALVQSYTAAMFAGVGSGSKDFETEKTPVGLWYDWAFHMTEGDMSAYVNMNSAMFSASATQDKTAKTAEGYANAIFVGSIHESLSYADESPFPYQIVVYESGEAVFTLRNPTESPIVVKFYGTLKKS